MENTDRIALLEELARKEIALCRAAELREQKMRVALNLVKAILTVPAAEYVPAIPDACTVIDDALRDE